MNANAAAPAVSVVMPVYNQSGTVKTAVDSILRQTLSDFELVIIDNGSTDSSPDVLSKIRDPRVRVFRNERNLGSAAAANRGVRESQAALIARMDAGDVALPHRLETQEAIFAADPRLALLGGQAQYLGACERPLLRRIAPKPLTRTAIRWASLFGSPFVHSTVMLRRASFDACGGYDERLERSSDFALFSKILARYPVANLNDVLVRYRSAPRTALANPTFTKLVRAVVHYNAHHALDASSADSALAPLITAWPDYCLMLRGIGDEAPLRGRLTLSDFLHAFHVRFSQLYDEPAAASEIGLASKFVLCQSAWDALRRDHHRALRFAAHSFARAPLFSSAFLVTQLADTGVERVMRTPWLTSQPRAVFSWITRPRRRHHLRAP